MKLTKLSKAVLALAIAAVIGTSAKAQITYTTGDVLIGFQESGKNDYVVDLGSIAQFINPSTPVETFHLSLSDISGEYLSGWATSSAVQWGVIGATNKSGFGTTTAGSSTLSSDTLFHTFGSTPTAKNVATQQTPTTAVFNLGNVLNTTATATAGSTASLQAAEITGGASKGFDNANTTNFGIGSGTANSILSSGSPTVASLEFYLVAPTNPIAGTTVTGVHDLGSFALNSSGVLTFTSTSVPEPSTYLLMGMSGLVLVWNVRRKANSVL